MKSLLPTVIAAITLTACGAGSPTAPTAAITPTRPTATLSGLVFGDTPGGLVPVVGARVRLDIGTFRLDAVTGQSGRYMLSGLYEGVSTLSTEVDGYELDTRKVTIGGDTRLDIRLDPRVPHTLSGVVFESTPSGRVLLEGVTVHRSDLHINYLTTGDGAFAFAGFYNGRNSLVASKDGYRTATVQPTVNGDTRFDIQLIRQ